MMHHQIARLFSFGWLLFVILPRSAPAADAPPPAPREFRAAWVATVNNIDWPSRPNLSTREQQAELLSILDRAVELRLNGLIVQVRTSADALYVSPFEPWSHYLTGTQGRPPEPFYDPLDMWVSEGHRRGLEIHAWCNPFRARIGTPEPAPDHISVTQPSIVRTYGEFLWLDPGEPLAAAHSLNVFCDIADRYDVDGLHLDDYFYPYPVQQDGQEQPFPDESSWQQYLRTGGRMTRDDWRRDNVNRFIREVHNSLRRRKPWLRFGISPFGIGRPQTAPGISGFDQYDKLYADAALWLREGWCDYFAPQLYWPIAQASQSFPVLYSYWQSENRRRIHLWPGLLTSRVGDARRPFSAQEIIDQIHVTRSPGTSSGHLHFSMRALRSSRSGLADQLKSGPYAQSALVPATPWLDDVPPEPPSVNLVRRDPREISLHGNGPESTWLFGIWVYADSDWSFRTVPGSQHTLDLGKTAERVVVTAVDRCGNESSRVSLDVSDQGRP